MKISFFLPSLSGGGAEKMVINLIEGLKAYPCELELIVADKVGEWLALVPEDISFVDLKAGRVIKSIPTLMRYLRKSKPDILVSGIDHANIAALIAGKCSGADVKNIITIQHMSTQISKVRQNKREKIVDLLKPMLYSKAERVVCVSDGICQEMMDEVHLPAKKLHRIYNPVLSEKQINGNIVQRKEFSNAEKIVVAAGRLEAVKDYPTLLSAMDIVRRKVDCKLFIFGEGSERKLLEEKIKGLGLEETVYLPGFAHDLHKELMKADLFVLSSITEGFGNVIVEAMAVGVPIVSTNCPCGPAEILEGGKYGTLVPVRDVVAMAEAIITALFNDFDVEKLKQRSKDFSIEKNTKKYFELFSDILQKERKA